MDLRDPLHAGRRLLFYEDAQVAVWRNVVVRIPGSSAGVVEGVQGRESVGQDLQSDLAAQLRVGRLPDLPHPALAEEGDDIVVTDRGAGCD